MPDLDLRGTFQSLVLKLDDVQLRIVERFATVKSFKSGEALIAAGVRDPNFYVVRSGEVEVFEYSSGLPQTVGINTARDLLGDASFLSGRASNLTRIARGEVEAFEISPENLRRIIDEESQLGNIILATLIRRIRTMHDLNLTPLRVVGSRFSGDTFRIRDFLTKNRMFFNWIDLENAPHVEELLQHLKITESDTPVVAYGCEWVLRNPTNRELAERLGILTAPKDKVYDLAIVGAGPSGLTAAVYGASEGLSTVVLERTATGGQAGTSSRIENYPGFPLGLSGEELAARITLQAQKFGALIVTPCEVQKLVIEDGYPVLHLDDGRNISAKSLLIATGASYRRLEVEGGRKYDGLGVYYAATPMEAQACAGAQVVVVGGANSAGQAAAFLAEHARKVLLIIRGDDLNRSMSRYLSRRIEQTGNIELLTNCEISRMSGNGHLESVEIKNNRNGEILTVETPAVFTFIGATPHTDWLPKEIETDDKGFVKTGPAVTESFWKSPRHPLFLETSCPGVFAAGDVRSSSMKRVASAVGEGAMAVAMVHEYFRNL